MLNNRELAIVVWTVLLIAFAATKPALRSAFANVAKVFIQWPIIAPLTLMACYIVLVVDCLTQAGLWDLAQLKNTILWGVCVAIVLLFRVVRSVSDPQFQFLDFFKDMIRDNLQLIVVLEFIISFYTFPLLAELVIVPVVSLVVMMKTYAGTKQEYASVVRLLDVILVAFGSALIIYAGYQLIVGFTSFATRDTLTEFALPPLLSLLFTPFLFLAGLLVSYENVFVRLKFAIPDASLRSYARWRAILGFRLRTTLLSRWARNVMLTKPIDRSAVDSSIRDVKVLSERERTPAEVPLNQGWSPYIASSFLESAGFRLDDYRSSFGDTDEWFANSPYQQVGEGLLPNNIAYYVEGNEFVATTLKLVMNVNEPQAAQEARGKFAKAAKLLHANALKTEVSSEIEQCLMFDRSISASIDGKNITLTKVAWPKHRFGGFEMRFIIGNSSSI